MIKILKEGTKQKVECDRCGATLKFDISDIKYDGIRHVVGFKKYIFFPQCGHEIIL